MLHISVIKDSVLIKGQQIKLTGHEMALASGNDLITHLITHCTSCYVLAHFSGMGSV